MAVLYIAIPLTLMLVAGFVLAFIWATNDGQYDDLDSPPLRILHDDDIS